MSTSYTYSLSSDLGGSVDQSQLFSEINVNENIAKTITGISGYQDDVIVTFSSALSGAEETELDSVITAHTPDDSKTSFDKQIVINPRDQKYSSTSYKRMAQFRYQGSTNMGIIKMISISSYVESSSSSYTIRVMDVTNAKVIGENTFTNTTEQYNVITPLSNIPVDKAVLEFHIKRDGKNKAYVEDINIYF